MKFTLFTDEGPCGGELERTCKIIALYYIVTTFLGAIVYPQTFSHFNLIIGFCIVLVANFALLFGAVWRNQWLVLVWLVQAALCVIGIPLQFFSVIFNVGNQRYILNNSVAVTLIYLIVALVIILLLGRYVLSYHRQLRKRTPTMVTI